MGYSKTECNTVLAGGKLNVKVLYCDVLCIKIFV